MGQFLSLLQAFLGRESIGVQIHTLDSGSHLKCGERATETLKKKNDVLLIQIPLLLPKLIELGPEYTFSKQTI